MGPTIPASYTVKDVKIFNSKLFSIMWVYIVDIGNKASLNYLIKEHITKAQKSGGQTPFLYKPIFEGK